MPTAERPNLSADRIDCRCCVVPRLLERRRALRAVVPTVPEVKGQLVTAPFDQSRMR